MKRSRYTEEQIIRVIKQHESGVKTQDICRELGIVEQTFYKWKANFLRDGRLVSQTASGAGGGEQPAQAIAG